MRLIEADVLLGRLKKAYERNKEYSVADGLAMAYEMVQGQPTVKAIPVEFIEAEIKRMHLETQIAVSEGDDERAERWIIRQVAVETVIAKWIAERKEE